MSLVTNYILSWLGGPEDHANQPFAKPMVARINDLLEKANEHSRFVLVDHLVEGSKAMECNLAIAAFNFCTPFRLFEVLEPLDWGDAMDIQCLVKDQEDEGWSVYDYPFEYHG